MAATSRPVVAELRRKGFVVVVFQPAQVRAYAKFHLQRAKNDKIDAALIAACTAAVKKIHAPPDPRLAPLAERMTLIDQLTDQIARFKNYREGSRDLRMRQLWKEQIAHFNKLLRAELKELVAAIRQHRDLAERLDLIESVDGVGLKTAVAILVRMPEIGSVTREQAASLVGLRRSMTTAGCMPGYATSPAGASGCAEAYTRRRCLQPLPLESAAGRALPASHRSGKLHKVALIACARKLLIFVNTVVERGTPWVEQQITGGSCRRVMQRWVS